MNTLQEAIQAALDIEKANPLPRQNANRVQEILDREHFVSRHGVPRPFVRRRFLFQVREHISKTEGEGFWRLTWNAIVKWISENMDVIIRIALQLLSLLLIL